MDELPTDYVCCGSVIFGVTGAGELASIRLASMTPEEAAHARSVLMGEGLEGDFEPMENEATMYTVKLENEFLRGAVWVLGEDGITTEGKLPLVEADPVVLELNEEIAEMYDSYFEFDSHDQGCWFNDAQRKADRDKMLSLLARLRVRLEEINDGSFTVVDYETPSLLGL